jgi:hypothetical protein
MFVLRGKCIELSDIVKIFVRKILFLVVKRREETKMAGEML